MVGITALGVLLTLAYDRKELAVIALLGGFASPFMASTGEGNFKVLFTYLLILDVGMLVLANYKKWHIINVIAFLLTAIIFGAWAVMRFSTLTPQPVWITFLFASAFFVVFFSMNLRYNLRHEHAFGPLDFSLLLANTAAYYGAGMYVLNALPMRITGAFTIVLALFHLVFAMLLFRKANVPRTLVYLLIGLVLTFISLAAPVQLHGNHITLFWAAECALLLWFSQRSGIRLVERASVLVLVLMLFSLMMDFAQHYGTNPLVRLTPLLNKPWITGMVSSVALGLYATLCDRLPQEREVLPGLLPRMLRNVAWTLFTVVLYLTNFLEVNHQLGYLCIQPVVAEALMAYSLFALLVADRLLKRAVKLTRSALLFGFAVLVFLYMVIFYANSRSALNELLTNNASGHLVFHYVTFALLIAALIRIAQLVRELITRPSQGWSIYLWTMCIALIIIGSQELDQVMLLIAHPTNSIVSAYDGSANAYAAMDTIQETLWRLRKAGYPILWGLGSFAFMWYGMRKRLRAIRIIALSLFALTLVKLFLFDIQGISEGGKVAAFISLGVLLLVVSFMYNKLKGLLKEDDQKMTP